MIDKLDRFANHTFSSKNIGYHVSSLSITFASGSSFVRSSIQKNIVILNYYF